jgi:hypothetical protein
MHSSKDQGCMKKNSSLVIITQRRGLAQASARNTHDIGFWFRRKLRFEHFKMKEALCIQAVLTPNQQSACLGNGLRLFTATTC